MARRKCIGIRRRNALGPGAAGGAGFLEGKDAGGNGAAFALPEGAGGGAGRRELLASLQGPASRGAGCLGGRGPAEGAEGTGQVREAGTGQRSPQQAVELAVEDGGGDAEEFRALRGQLHDR